MTIKNIFFEEAPHHTSPQSNNDNDDDVWCIVVSTLHNRIISSFEPTLRIGQIAGFRWSPTVPVDRGSSGRTSRGSKPTTDIRVHTI